MAAAVVAVARAGGLGSSAVEGAPVPLAAAVQTQLPSEAGATYSTLPREHAGGGTDAAAAELAMAASDRSRGGASSAGDGCPLPVANWNGGAVQSGLGGGFVEQQVDPVGRAPSRATGGSCETRPNKRRVWFPQRFIAEI